MFGRRRKSVAQPQASAESEDDGDISNEKSARNKRMRDDEEEEFVAICVKYFDQINDKTTIRGNSAHKKSQDKTENAWASITTEMNQRYGVGFLQQISIFTFE